MKRYVCHYAGIERPTESDNSTYVGESACGIEYPNEAEDDWNLVTCKRCLKFAPKNVVQICAWCPDKEERTKRAESEGKTVSHGVCPTCAKKHFR